MWFSLPLRSRDDGDAAGRADAVPAAAALAFGRPVRPPSSWTWTVLPGLDIGRAGRRSGCGTSCRAPVVTLIVWPFAVLMVSVSPSTDSTVPWTVSPPPSPPPKPPRPKPGAPLAPGAKLPPGKAPSEDATVARSVAPMRPPCRDRREGDAADRDGGGDDEDEVEPAAAGRRLAGRAGGRGDRDRRRRDRRRGHRRRLRRDRLERLRSAAGSRDGSVRSVMWFSLSFVAEGGDGIESGGLARRPDAEDDADREAEQDGGDDRRGVERRSPSRRAGRSPPRRRGRRRCR